MRIVTASQMRQIDRRASEKFGIPALILMENAAIAAASCALKMLGADENKALFICGQGNNGGDGLACARHLLNRGLKIKVYFAGQLAKLSPESRINYQILRKMGQPILKPDLSSLKTELAQTDLVVDALLGIGLQGKVRPAAANLIELINQSNKPVLALDIPSGLDATTGETHGLAVVATRTITFGLFKRGFLNPLAKKFTGELTIGDIGLPRKLLC